MFNAPRLSPSILSSRLELRALHAAAIVAAVAAPGVTARAAPVKLDPPAVISREVLFGNPERVSARVSPDGSRIAFIAPSEGVLNVWVAPAGELAAAKPVTKDTGPILLADLQVITALKTGTKNKATAFVSKVAL
jgi:hypothetical protein